ncbi:uncharacterized protein N7473_008682 [Penicillium subrubescens]|uniref:uncharacterized protein n=1 Tax=Penicillium subrubescens TaxID=1316194 RepID=UPI00254590B6|nr:uncharacterized protein N7473_008682 [Penicillium subrubescens]KAJ5886008.1 hypothetical protein N7473_008682 [Penicillium subrubescens]
MIVRQDDDYDILTIANNHPHLPSLKFLSRPSTMAIGRLVVTVAVEAGKPPGSTRADIRTSTLRRKTMRMAMLIETD